MGLIIPFHLPFGPASQFTLIDAQVFKSETTFVDCPRKSSSGSEEILLGQYQDTPVILDNLAARIEDLSPPKVVYCEKVPMGNVGKTRQFLQHIFHASANCYSRRLSIHSGNPFLLAEPAIAYHRPRRNLASSNGKQ